MCLQICEVPCSSKTTKSEETSYLHTFVKFLLHFYMYVYAYVWACAYHDTYVEVRGQLVLSSQDCVGPLWIDFILQQLCSDANVNWKDCI